MRIIGLICLLFLVKPSDTNATELSRWSSDKIQPTNDSLDYINDKLFTGVCTVDANVGHAFCLDNMDLSSKPQIGTALAMQGLNQNISSLNPQTLLLVQPQRSLQDFQYIHYYHDGDSVEGGLKLPLFW
ncbi:MAG: hypothetical protein AAF632_02510 [Bacteroidota bacterium]